MIAATRTTSVQQGSFPGRACCGAAIKERVVVPLRPVPQQRGSGQAGIRLIKPVMINPRLTTSAARRACQQPTKQTALGRVASTLAALTTDKDCLCDGKASTKRLAPASAKR